VIQNGGLLFKNVNDSHEGEYLCKARNGIGSGISKLITLRVDGNLLQPCCPKFSPFYNFLVFIIVPPSFENNATLATQTAIVSHEAAIKCEVVGDQPLHISWKRNGTSLAGHDHQLQVSHKSQ
jgi:hypothetical protein